MKGEKHLQVYFSLIGLFYEWHVVYVVLFSTLIEFIAVMLLMIYRKKHFEMEAN